MKQKALPQGLSGWLVLVGINVVVSPVIFLRTLVYEYTQILTTEAWILQTSPGTAFYQQWFKTLIIAEVMFNVCLLLWSLYLVRQFFARKAIFPRAYSRMLVCSLLVLVVDALIINLVFPEFLTFTPESMAWFGRAALSALICIPYLKYSERVKNTFVE